MNHVSSVYLAARFSKQPEMRKIRDLFLQEKINVTSTWLDQHPNGDLGDDPVTDTRNAIRDLVDVRVADGLVFFSEAQLARRGGRHVEFGYALALGKPIYVVGNKENIFHYTPGIKHYQTVQEVVQEITLSNLLIEEMAKGKLINERNNN